MIGLDTNVLIRAIVDSDDPVQTGRARAYLAAHCTAQSPGYVDAVVLCETVWVLGGPLGYPRDAVFDLLDRLLNQKTIRVESADLALEALRTCRDSRLDFADVYIGLRNDRRGARPTVTFDKRAARLPWFKEI
ncbi:MAG: hypothetical protein RLY86_2944 [Pseudomonadota bacterium]|jgi:predicted nucleic-acid-binding protein